MKHLLCLTLLLIGPPAIAGFEINDDVRITERQDKLRQLERLYEENKDKYLLLRCQHDCTTSRQPALDDFTTRTLAYSIAALSLSTSLLLTANAYATIKSSLAKKGNKE